MRSADNNVINPGGAGGDPVGARGGGGMMTEYEANLREQLARALAAQREDLRRLQVVIEQRDHARAWCTYWRHLYKNGTARGPDQREHAMDGWSARHDEVK